MKKYVLYIYTDEGYKYLKDFIGYEELYLYLSDIYFNYP